MMMAATKLAPGGGSDSVVYPLAEAGLHALERL